MNKIHTIKDILTVFSQIEKNQHIESHEHCLLLIANTEVINNYVYDQLSKTKENPFYLLYDDGQVKQNKLYLAQGNMYDLYVTEYTTKNSSIENLSGDMLITPLMPSTFFYNQYEEICVSDQQWQLKYIAEEQIKYGACVLIKANKTVIQAIKKENQNGYVMLCLEKKEKQLYKRIYDLHTLASTDIKDLEEMKQTKQQEFIESYFDILTHMYLDDQAVGEITNIEKLLSHENDKIRWEALRALFDIDFNLGLKGFHQLKKDPHPLIQEKIRLLEQQLSDTE